MELFSIDFKATLWQLMRTSLDDFIDKNTLPKCFIHNCLA